MKILTTVCTGFLQVGQVGYGSLAWMVLAQAKQQLAWPQLRKTALCLGVSKQTTHCCSLIPFKVDSCCFPSMRAPHWWHFFQLWQHLWQAPVWPQGVNLTNTASWLQWEHSNLRLVLGSSAVGASCALLPGFLSRKLAIASTTSWF